jgi:p-aminobenzoyl-glutamate transporter AbgT
MCFSEKSAEYSELIPKIRPNIPIRFLKFGVKYGMVAKNIKEGTAMDIHRAMIAHIEEELQHKNQPVHLAYT